ncbi:MAG: type II toxin-antitoxin system RelE/ParE family toxin [Candidatus Eisenbacteria bacterium]|nr:type II toxin-antitoxin system RelE/ParE family toxin [Candidatus Eisenbacteria bacterium]
MPQVVFFRENDGSVPMLEWIVLLPEGARDRCKARIERLRTFGHLLRRPKADFLRDGIHELRVKHEGVNYRLLYFFFGRDAVVLTQGFVKRQARVPASELERALRRRVVFTSDPERHMHAEA